MNMEHELQKAAVNYFRLQYPCYTNKLFAIPNGGQRNVLVAKKLKAEGVLPGVYDLFLMIPKKGCHGLWIETKFGRNKLTDNQKRFKKDAEEEGYLCETYSCLDKFMKIINNYLS